MGEKARRKETRKLRRTRHRWVFKVKIILREVGLD
jgi:hypothetical protein